jgi:hypothetical protein
MKIEAEERRGEAEIEQSREYGNRSHESDGQARSAADYTQTVPDESDPKGDPQNAADR